jgi:hypothetical protein
MQNETRLLCLTNIIGYVVGFEKDFKKEFYARDQHIVHSLLEGIPTGEFLSKISTKA